MGNKPALPLEIGLHVAGIFNQSSVCPLGICCSKILSSSFNTFNFHIKQPKALKTDWYGYKKPQKVGPTQYLAVRLQTICCVSLIHRSSQSQRNRWKWSFRKVQQLLCNYFMLVWAGYFRLEYYVLIVAFQEALLAMTQSSCCIYQNKRTSLLKEMRTTQRTNKSALYAHRIYSKSFMHILSQPALLWLRWFINIIRLNQHHEFKHEESHKVVFTWMWLTEETHPHKIPLIHLLKSDSSISSVFNQ